MKILPVLAAVAFAHGVAAQEAEAPAAEAAEAETAPAAEAEAAPAGETAEAHAGIPIRAEEAAAVTEKSLAAPRPAHLFPVPPPLETKEDRIIFPHALHVEDMGTECSMCHADVEEAGNIAQSNAPEMSVCGECHDIESEDNCGMCHTNPEEPSATVPSWSEDLIFSHKGHLANEKIDCRTCHPGAWTSNDASDRLTPKMATCTTCHQDTMDRLACQSCHTDMTMLTESDSQVAVHKANFFAFHDAWAVGSAPLCAQCHEQQFCSECHERTSPVKPSIEFPEAVDKQLMHRGDFIGRHALEANARPGSCQSCHGQTFCSECHERVFGEEAVSFSASPHPTGYITRGGAGFHGADARMNPVTCASCHDQGAASNCVDCHRVGGIGGNPHPPGWDRQEDRRRETRACTPCHLTSGG